MEQAKSKQPTKATRGNPDVKVTADAAGLWVAIGSKEAGEIVYFGPFSETDPRVVNLRDKVLCR